MSERDDFSAKTIRTLAARVGYRCSNPTCMGSTSGPALEEERTVNIGVAAHIAAAAAGGKRYNPNMSPAERSGGGNGIWLCQSCSKLIDSDETRYTVELLNRWKSDAVRRALDAVAGGETLGMVKPSAMLDSADEEFLRGLNLPSAEAVDAVTTRLRTTAQIDIEAFRAARGQPARIIARTLKIEGKTATHSITIESLASLTTLAEPVAIIASGGTGKSTILVQLAEHMVRQDLPIPLLVPLGEWSDRQEDFFEFILRRNAFSAFRRQHLMISAYHGKLAFLLDGWNELTAEARLRATNDLAALQRDYPQLGIIITSRRQALPTINSVATIETLDHNQQLELAQTIRGAEGEELVDKAWRTTGLRELVGSPLYLNALLTLQHGVILPETKEAALGLFVSHNETEPSRLERLQRDTLGFHSALLTSLAVEANRISSTIISHENANRVITKVLRQLSEDGQIATIPNPRNIIDGLVNAHLLIRMPGVNGAISFQHQLFQEWYAAEEVEKLMIKAALGDPRAQKQLREEMLDQTSWEESILFACDRLSRANKDGENAVAIATSETLRIDPLLAAKMLERATDAVWQSSRARVMTFIKRWHTPGVVDRAVRFMVTSGKPEFSDFIWPLASSTNEQIQFNMFRAADRFNPKILGLDSETRLRALPIPQRKNALTEIASNSGFDGMEFAAVIAASDPDPEVVVAVIACLESRGADRHINQIMTSASDLTWEALACESYPEHLTDTQLNSRLSAEREAQRTDRNASHLLDWIIDKKPTDAANRIEQLIATTNLSTNDSLRFEKLIAQANSDYPGTVALGLVARFLSNLTLPYWAIDYLAETSMIDSGPVAEAALDTTTSTHRQVTAATMVGPTTTAALFDQLFTIEEQIRNLARHDKQLSDAHYRLIEVISKVRQDAFVPAFIANTESNDPDQISLLADVFARYGNSRGDSATPFDTVHRTALHDVIQRWIETLLEAPRLARSAACNVARAAGRLADATLAEPLLELLERDIEEYNMAFTQHLPAVGRSNSIPIGYTRTYTRAFKEMRDEPAAAILIRHLGDLHWGRDAAAALHDIWLTNHSPQAKHALTTWPDYSNHLAHRALRSTDTPPTSDFAEAIFSVANALGNPSRTDAEQKHALMLAAIGLALPHGNKRPSIDDLLALPQPITAKHRLLMSAARTGEIIPAELLMEGVQGLLAASQAHPWRLDENRGELMEWIELFPFSDSPESVHEAIALLPTSHRQPHQLRRLFQKLPQGPADTALAILEKIAENPEFLRESEWTNSILKLGTEDSAKAVLNHLCSGQEPAWDAHQLSFTLATLARNFPSIRTTVIDQYRSSPPGGIRRTLERVMVSIPDEQIFMTLFDMHADTPDSTFSLQSVIRNLALDRSPSKEWLGAFEVFGLPLTELRAKLFAMLPTNDARAVLAKQCLIEIEEYRDDYGRPTNEPRHPDISTGRSWPTEAE
ncbi:NACHT domain-containing protein [Pseudomonas solani]|uniref:NACHT domain-containing protein n=1 Tax=Pseudomonas solani TaxID=2731552 RepID=UPI003C2EDF27